MCMPCMRPHVDTYTILIRRTPYKNCEPCLKSLLTHTSTVVRKRRGGHSASVDRLVAGSLLLTVGRFRWLLSAPAPPFHQRRRYRFQHGSNVMKCLGAIRWEACGEPHLTTNHDPVLCHSLGHWLATACPRTRSQYEHALSTCDARVTICVRGKVLSLYKLPSHR